MEGLAKALFYEKEGHIPWKGGWSQPRSPWPRLQRMVALRQLPYIDHAVAQRVLAGYSGADEDTAILVCCLASMSRQGHLCLCVEGERLSPHPRDVWGRRAFGVCGDAELTEADLELLAAAITRAAVLLPADLVSDVSGDASASTPLCRWQRGKTTLLYLQRHWTYESRFLVNLRRLGAATPAVALDTQKVNQELARLEESGKLLPEQALAIKKACARSLTVISGGPGTGKTYTAGRLIKVCWEAIPPDERRRCRIALAAPTGKAAANLQASLRAAMAGREELAGLTATTLHTLLGVRGSEVKRQGGSGMLAADIVVVDETSMVDARLMAYLFAAVKTGTRLILLGDRHQLPPVEPGALFSDLMQLPEACDSVGERVELTRCLRAEQQEIVTLAAMINAGDGDGVLGVLNSGAEAVSRVASDGDERAVQRRLLALVEKRFPSPSVVTSSDVELMTAFNRFRILSPLRRGPLGVETLNGLIAAMQSRKLSPEQPLLLPILVVSNDYDLQLFNGEVGVLVRRCSEHTNNWCSCEKEDYALFPHPDGGVRRLPAVILPKIELAFCLTVHKSQGSEFDELLLLMPKGSETFGREVLYTGVTRARKRLQVVASDSTLTAAIDRTSFRQSGLTSRVMPA